MIVNCQVHSVPALAFAAVKPALTGDAVAHALDTPQPLGVNMQ
jgi:hypothetical protein